MENKVQNMYIYGQQISRFSKDFRNYYVQLYSLILTGHPFPLPALHCHTSHCHEPCKMRKHSKYYICLFPKSKNPSLYIQSNKYNSASVTYRLLASLTQWHEAHSLSMSAKGVLSSSLLLCILNWPLLFALCETCARGGGRHVCSKQCVV